MIAQWAWFDLTVDPPGGSLCTDEQKHPPHHLIDLYHALDHSVWISSAQMRSGLVVSPGRLTGHAISGFYPISLRIVACGTCLYWKYD